MCWYCGSPVTHEEPIGRSARCETCGKDLRACNNCRFLMPGSRGDCRETSAEKQPDKERSNFCDWFSLDEKLKSQGTGQSAAAKEREKAEAARTAFDNLFK
jgi:hypothetical protein